MNKTKRIDKPENITGIGGKNFGFEKSYGIKCGEGYSDICYITDVGDNFCDSLSLDSSNECRSLANWLLKAADYLESKGQ